MANPFLRRATEFIRDDSVFISLVSPEPLNAFVARQPNRDALYSMPVRIIGSPGTGKTMMATLVEFRLVEAILRDLDRRSEPAKDLAAAFERCRLTEQGAPAVAAVRLPMESEYREFWELPYPPQVKAKLVMSLVQARAVLGLLDNLTAGGRRDLNDVRFVFAGGAGEARREQVGGENVLEIRDRARAVERAVYSVGSRLVSPALDDLSDEATSPYQPFAAIEAIEIPWDGGIVRLKPLVVFDDVHALHPDQFASFFRELARREVRIGRWLMMRFDALSPDAVFRSADEDALPGLKAGRDFADIFMQSDGTRLAERKRFEKMAADMADRYVTFVQPLRERQHREFRPLLPVTPSRLSAAEMARLRSIVDKDQRVLEIGAARREAIERLPAEYAVGAKSQDVGEDVRLAMTRVLLHRYSKRLRNRELALFGDADPDPDRPLKADAGVADAARVYLLHEFRRPYHYGFDVLCQASNENAEIFLQLAGALVERMVTRATRGRDPALPPTQQQQELREKAEEMIKAWSFPFARKVRRLVQRIADDCEEEARKPNAALKGGANAIAIPDADMAKLLARQDELTFVLKYAIAYGALVAVRPYGQGGEEWCLLELSGPVCLKHGLTLNRGGFLKRRASDLADAIQDGA